MNRTVARSEYRSRRSVARRVMRLIPVYQQQPDNSTVLKQLGIGLCRLGKFAASEKLLRRAADLIPTDSEVLNFLAIAVGSLSRTDEAILIFAEAARLNPSDVTIRSNFGFALKIAGHQQLEITQLQATLTLEPGDLDALHDLANAEFDLGDYSDAIVHLSEESRLDVGDKYVVAKLAHANYKLGNEPVAAAILEELDRPELDYDVLNYMGIIYDEMGKHREAKHFYERALAAIPKDCYNETPTICDIWMNLGIACDRLGELDDATLAYQNALQCGEDADVHINIGANFELRGDLDAAWQSYVRALAIDSKNALALRNLLNLIPDAVRPA